ncbi:hypothetical protein I3760_10G097900 [Carya illinoinensis]|nr:hypothetical protein I3760_10G097900 [Carya illinoinensis]
MQPRILSWNVREINDVNKRLRIRSLIHSWKVDIVCLQETKLCYVDKNIVRSLWGCSSVGWCYLASLGASGGVLLMWNIRVVELVEECIGNYFVGSFKNIEDGWRWALVCVCGPNVVQERSSLWAELAGMYYLWDLPWVVCGDFNVVRFPCERERATYMTRSMEEFSELIFDLNLIDLPLFGGCYTWSNGRGGSRLDRFLKRLSQVFSNHFPILLESGGIHGALKLDLKKWNMEVFRHTDEHKRLLWNELDSLEVGVKSRMTWLKEGDKCTKFFHKMANSHRRNNVIDVLHSGNTVHKSPEAIQDHIVSYYEDLLKETVLKDFRPISLVGGIYKIIPKVLANHMSLVMEKIISKS